MVRKSSYYVTYIENVCTSKSWETTMMSSGRHFHLALVTRVEQPIGSIRVGKELNRLFSSISSVDGDD